MTAARERDWSASGPTDPGAPLGILNAPSGPQVGCCGTERAHPRVCMAGELAGAACEPWAAGAEHGTALEQLLRRAGGLSPNRERKWEQLARAGWQEERCEGLGLLFINTSRE